MVHARSNFGIVDEVGSILIDEARTPLIISGPTDDKSNSISASTTWSSSSARIMRRTKSRKSIRPDRRRRRACRAIARKRRAAPGQRLYDIENTQVVHHVNEALKAIVMFRRDTDYIVKDGKVVIIDEFTGRMMDGRRWSDGLREAVEAKGR